MCSRTGCDLKTCGKLRDFDLCEDHFQEIRLYFLNSLHNAPIFQSISKGYLDHSQGYTYILLTSSGLIKIGYTGRDAARGLRDRAKSSVEKLDALSCLAIIDGGMTMEACIHWELRNLRIPGTELFRLEAETVEVISRGVGHDLVPVMNSHIQHYRSKA